MRKTVLHFVNSKNMVFFSRDSPFIMRLTHVNFRALTYESKWIILQPPNS